MSRTPPYDNDAEVALLGACMLHRAAVEAAVETLGPSDFYTPKHAAIFAAIEVLYHRLDPIDPITLGELVPTVDRGELARIQAATPAAANAGHYARIVAEAAYLRRVILLGADLVEHGYQRDQEYVSDALHSHEDRVRPPVGSVEPGIDVNDLHGLEAGVSWLVPGLLEQGDRVVVTGPEGHGKTTLMRQVALACAAGVHPFHHTTITPVRVLYVDLQEREAQLGRAFRSMMTATGCAPQVGMLSVKPRRQGMNLRADADRRWLEALVRHHRAQLVAVGPAYKAWAGDAKIAKHSEEAVEQLHAVFDRMTERYGCGFILEAHSPHGDGGNRAEWRPYGASAWLRWPEFGVALQPHAGTTKLKHWRGDRERGREWPEKLLVGRFWPWIVPGLADAALL